jgi:SAM-dependent methyltransferase
MTQNKNEYVWRAEATDLATARLDQLEQLLDPTTYRHLDRIGVPRGGRCWEIGAGRGSTALYLLSRCGLGEVVATDIDVQWLRQIEHPQLRVVEHDIVNDELEPLGRFDLIHTRMVIHHLGADGGAAAVRRAASTLNPGGVILIEEPIGLNRAQPGHPDAASFEDLTGALISALTASNGLDMDCGLRLPALLRNEGLVDVAAEISGSVTRGDDPFRRWMRTTYEVSKHTVSYDKVFDGRTDDWLRLNDDQELDHNIWVVSSTSGRKPTTTT